MSVVEEYVNYLGEEITGQAGEQDKHEGFSVTNDATANWCCRKVEQIRGRMAERAEFARSEVERLHAWRENADEQDQKAIDFFTSLLKSYFDRLLESGALGKRKSYKLPHGTLKVRKQQPHYERDEAKLRPWAIEMGLTRAPEPDWAAVKQRGMVVGNSLVDSETGELIPGVVIFEQPAVFTVATGGDN